MNSSKPPGFSPSELASLSVWRMPSVRGNPESVDLAGVQNSASLSTPVLTVDKIEAMQKQAYDEAFAEGRKDGYSEAFVQGEKDGYSEGFKEGSRQGYDENVQLLQKKAAEFVSLLESLSQPFKILDAEVEKELVKLAIAIATQIVRREIKLEPGQVIAAVREAINVLPLSSQKISLHLHPEDADLVRSTLSLDEMSPAWMIIEDPLLTRGGCIVDTEVSHIDATVENRLAAVISTILGGEREHDGKDSGGTTPWAGEVESRLEQGSRAPTVGDTGAVTEDNIL